MVRELYRAVGRRVARGRGRFLPASYVVSAFMPLGLTHWPPGFSRKLMAVSSDGQLSMIAWWLLVARTHGMPCGCQTRGKETVSRYRSVQWESGLCLLTRKKQTNEKPLS